MKFVVFIAAMLTALGLTALAAPAGSGALDGAALYQKHCSGCHGGIKNTTKPGRRYARIASAIKFNVGGMNTLKDISSEELVVIADALSMIEPPEEATGDKLYSLYCASCHRPIDETDIKGKSMAEIEVAIQVRMCQTVNLRFLGDDNIEKISGALKDAGE